MNSFHLAPGIHWGYTLSLIGVGALVAVLAGMTLGAWLGRTRRPAPASPSPSHNAGAVFDGLAAQRAALVSGCVKVRGLLEDQVLSDLLDDALRRGGVQVVNPVGSRVDARQHRTVGTQPAAGPEQDGVIARTLRPGFIDTGRVVGTADVVVYKWEN
jgi:hypothetical protein